MHKPIAFVAATLILATPAGLAAQPAQNPPPPQSAADANRPPPPPITTVNPGDAPGEPTTVTREYPSNLTPPPASAMNREYPVCTAKIQDSCQNPGEGGAPGRSRALDHWPGEPASQSRSR